MLADASKAAHEIKVEHWKSEDEGYPNHDRVTELGYVTDIASGLCAAHLHVLCEVAWALQKIESGDHDDDDKPVIASGRH